MKLTAVKEGLLCLLDDSWRRVWTRGFMVFFRDKDTIKFTWNNHFTISCLTFKEPVAAACQHSTFPLEQISINPTGQSWIISQRRILYICHVLQVFECGPRLGSQESMFLSPLSCQPSLHAVQHEQSTSKRAEMFKALPQQTINPLQREASAIDSRQPFVRFDFWTNFSHSVKNVRGALGGSAKAPRGMFRLIELVLLVAGGPKEKKNNEIETCKLDKKERKRCDKTS